MIEIQRQPGHRAYDLLEDIAQNPSVLLEIDKQREVILDFVRKQYLATLNFILQDEMPSLVNVSPQGVVLYSKNDVSIIVTERIGLPPVS